MPEQSKRPRRVSRADVSKPLPAAGVAPDDVAGPLPDGGPRPIDPTPPYPSRRFVVDVDWSIVLGDDAARRIERRIREAVLAEIAQIEVAGELVVRALPEGGATRGVQLIARQ